jgi:predicted nucleotidyltransferase
MRAAPQLKQTYIPFEAIISFKRSVWSMEIFPLDERRQKAIDEFVRRASQTCGDRIRGITLFGSHARGTPSPDSDIDLLVIIDQEDFRIRRELIRIAFDILLETGCNISVKALSSQDYQARRSFSFLRNVLAEGIKVA